MQPGNTPRQFCAIDTEGTTGEIGWRGLALVTSGTQEYLTRPADAHEALEWHAGAGYTFIAHNAPYDIAMLIKYLDLSITTTRYNGTFHHAAWKWARNRPSAEIWCSYQLSGKMKLEKLGRAIGLPKYPTPQHLKGFDADKYLWKCERHDQWECEECYAIRDADIVYRYISGLASTLAGWQVDTAPSLPGIALGIWRELDHALPPGIGSRYREDFARHGYYGGRVENFIYGRVTPCYVADQSGAYGAIMLRTPMPDPKYMVDFEHPPGTALPTDCEGVAECTILVPSMHVPPLPYSIGGARCYPVGRLHGVWPLIELRHAVAQGCRIERIDRLLYSTSSLYPFPNFVGVLWELRQAYQDQHDPRELVAKLLINSLPGRLGTHEQTERTTTQVAPRGWRSSSSKRPYDTDFIGGRLYLSSTAEQSFGGAWSNVLWAAQITAAQRVHLRHLMLLQGEDLAYTDTDSIFSQKPVQGLGEGLGGLKPEGEYQAAVLCQPKLYALQNLKGEWQANGKGIEGWAAARFIQDHAVTEDTPISWSDAQRTGQEPGSWTPVSRRVVPQTYRRQPRNVPALLDPSGCSHSDPLVAGPLSIPHLD